MALARLGRQVVLVGCGSGLRNLDLLLGLKTGTHTAVEVFYWGVPAK